MSDAMTPNRTTPEGRELGRMLAGFCDQELAGKNDSRCRTCAFRAGNHLANGSPETLMGALKCAECQPPWGARSAVIYRVEFDSVARDLDNPGTTDGPGGSAA